MPLLHSMGTALLLTTSLIASAQQMAQQAIPDEDRSKLPNYPAQAADFVAGPPMPGVIRVWGNDFMAKLEGLWEEGFHKTHPEIKFDDTLKSSAQALAGLYTNVADLGLLGREVWPTEVLGFQKMFQYEPLGIAVATGSFHTEGKTWPFIIFVNKSNPVSKLTLQQLDAIFGTGLRRGAKEPITTWGQLGVTGPQASHRIHVYGYDMIIPGFTYGFQQIVFKGSDKWTGDLREYTNAHRPDGKLIHTAGDLMLDDLAKDPMALPSPACSSPIQVSSTSPSPKTMVALTSSRPCFQPPTAHIRWCAPFTSCSTASPANRLIQSSMNSCVTFLVVRVKQMYRRRVISSRSLQRSCKSSCASSSNNPLSDEL